MTDQAEFDRLRATCSTRLKQFIAQARKTERRMQQLRLPVGVEEDLQFLFQRGAEVQACENYLLASLRFRDFLHPYIIH